MINAIQPVITRVPVNEDEFDIDDLRDILLNQFEEEIKTLSSAQMKIKAEDILDDDELQNSKEANDQNDDEQEMNQHLKDLREFYTKLAAKTIAYDPLDRQIPDEDND